MIGFESIRYSLRNIAHRKARSFLTVLSVFIGIATIFIFISFGLGLYGYINEIMEGGSADKIIVQAKSISAPGLDDTFKLTDSDLRAVRNTAGAFETSGAYIKAAKVEFNEESKYVYLMGYDPDVPIIMDLMDVGISEGRELRDGDEGSVTLGYNYLVKDKIFSKPVALGNKILVQGKKMRVIGFYESVGNPQDDSNVYIVNDAIDEVYPDTDNSYAWIVSRVDVDDITEVVNRVEDNLRDNRDLDEGKEDFTVQSFSDLISSYADVMNIIIGFVVLIALISVVVSAVNTANTMITSVLERVKEIGVIKAIGGKNSEIFGIFLFESSFLGMVAGCIGVALGWGLAYTGGVILDNLGWGFLAPVFPNELFIGCVLFATITGAISGVVPAMNASRINVVDALRYE
jgi:putative ABC transport system permease protein